MKKDVVLRFAIMGVMLIAIGIIFLAEIGIATLFNMSFEGLSYLEFLKEFYTIPWHFMLALLIMVVIFIVIAETIYRKLVKE